LSVRSALSRLAEFLPVVRDPCPILTEQGWRPEPACDQEHVDSPQKIFKKNKLAMMDMACRNRGAEKASTSTPYKKSDLRSVSKATPRNCSRNVPAQRALRGSQVLSRMHELLDLRRRTQRHLNASVEQRRREHASRAASR